MTAVTQATSCQPAFAQATAAVQNYPTGYSVMGYPRHAFGQGAFVNTGYQVFPGQQRQSGSGSGPAGQSTQQVLGNQSGQGQPQNIFLNYGKTFVKTNISMYRI